MEGDSIPDMSRSIRKIVKIISETDENIILQSWVRAGLTGESEEIHLGEDEHDESGVDLEVLSLTDDREAEIQELQVVPEDKSTKKMKQKSILDFFKS